MIQEWSCGLTGPKQRTYKYMVESVILQPFTQYLGLTKTQLRQWWVYNAQTIFNPLRLSMSNQYKFHDDNLVCISP